MQAQYSAPYVSPSEFSSFSGRRDDFSEVITAEFNHKLNLIDGNGGCSSQECEETEQRPQQQPTGDCNQYEDDEEEEGEDDDDDDDGFEFSFVCGDGTNSPISADDIFHNGKIKPIFPLFGTEFAVEQILDLPPPSSPKKPGANTETEDEIDAETEGMAYCLWSRNVPPSGETCRKSNSTGFSKLRRFRELLLLQRSQSDGKDAFVFLTEKRGGEEKGKEPETASSLSSALTKKKMCSLSGSAECKAGKNSNHKCQHGCVSEEKSKMSTKPMPYREKGKTVSSSGMRRKSTPPSSSSYVPYGSGSNTTNNVNGREKRRSYLPYRQDLVGFFTSASTISRNVHPY